MTSTSTGPVPSPLPRYVYKIIPEAPPSTLPAEWPLSDLDRNDGFIHLSTAKQARGPRPGAVPIPITAGLFFTSASRLWVLKLPFDRFAAGIRWEVPDTDGCPHLYGANFGAADVLDTKGFARGEGQVWADALEGDAWLEQ